MLLCSLGLEKLIFQGTKLAFGGLSLVRISHIFEDPIRSGLRWRFGARGPTRVVVVLFWACFLFQITVNAQVKEIRRALILSDLGVISSPGFAEIVRAISEGLQESPYQIEFYNESLEVTLFQDELYRRRFREEFIQKYSDRKPDVIITAGSESLNFIAELHEPFVRDTPIIFCTVLGEIPDRTGPDMHLTGVLGKLHPQETLNAALRLLPGTKHVAVVGGMGPFDVKWEGIAKQSFQKYESKLEFTYLTDLTMPALLERLKHLPSNTIVYHTALTRDAAGKRFIDSAQSVPLVASAANAPVFVMDDVDLRAGAVGGDLVNWADDARVAAEMAVRVLNGEKPQNIPFVTSNNAYMFDWRALQRWGLKESDLPPRSIVLNRQLTFWEANKRYVISGMVLLLLQTLIIVGLLWQRSMRRKTEVELVSSNERLRAALDRLDGIIISAMDAIIVVDAEQRTVVFNPAAEIMFGSASVDAVGAPIDRFIPHAFRRTDLGHITDFGETHVTNRQGGTLGNLWALKANGQEFPIEASISQMGTNNKKLFTLIIRDITERKEAEETRFLHAAIVESSDDAIISLKLDGTILSWNVGAQRMYGYSETEVLGRPIFKIIPAELQEEEQGLLQQVRTGRGIEHYETVRLTKEGKCVDVSVTISPLRDWTGNIVGASKIARDITVRKLAEAALRESEERFRLVANTAPVMIWMSGSDKLRTYFNQPWLKFTGRSIHEQLGNGWAARVHPEDLKTCLETYTNAFDRRETFEIEYRLRRHDGEFRWVFDLGVPRSNPDGSFAGYIGSCIDVTERKLAEEALSAVSRRLIEAQEQERTRIARELHDDINQRVALLAANLSFLKRDLPDAANAARQGIEQTEQQLTELGSDIQALSHHLHSSKLEYLGLAAAARGFCREFSERQKVEVHFHSDELPKALPPEISLCLFRVLQEALQNAMKHSASACFDVSLGKELNEIQLSVRDSGRGFDVDEAMNGRGVGLVSMKERLKLVGGQLFIDSKMQQGTTIRASVPLSPRMKSAGAVG
jgi:PAS domain S-box-containing protein